MTHQTRRRHKETRKPVDPRAKTGYATTYSGDNPGDRYFVSPGVPMETNKGHKYTHEWHIFDREPTEKTPSGSWDDLYNTYDRLYLANAECDRLNAEHAALKGANA